MGRLWDYCAFCGKRIETGEKCYGLPNGESVCTDCCVAENEGAAVSDGGGRTGGLTMAEYIEREALREILDGWRDAHADVNDVHGCGLLEDVICEVDAQTAADVAPVVHGRWVTHYRSGTSVAKGYVSTCCDMWNNRKSDYCPNCGARMDGGDSDETD